jgi:hypothetical protein
MKNLWLSAISVPEPQVRELLQKLKTYGLNPSGHAWQDDIAAMAWVGPRDALIAKECTFWAIMGSGTALNRPETRYGLSLLALCVQSRRGAGFPIVVLQTDSDPLSAADLPTPLQKALILPAIAPGTPAKLVAKAHRPAPELPAPFYLDMVGSAQIGQWFELRPTQDYWPGVIFGIDQGEIKFQAVGPAGALPTTSTLNFPMQGLKIEVGERAYTAWAVRNTISAESSYYVKVEGTPGSLIFGPFSENSETEMVVIDLQ